MQSLQQTNRVCGKLRLQTLHRNNFKNIISSRFVYVCEKAKNV